jgi:hypothetical protein
VKPTYAPVSTNPKIMNLVKNHNHPPPPRAGGNEEEEGFIELFRPFFPFSALAPVEPCPLCAYRFFVDTEMMSWLSASSPVSALKPRYATEGILTSPRVKQFSHFSSDLYCRSRVRDLSWK